MRAFLIASSLLLATVALAHEAIGPNGGRLVDAGNLHVELVPKGRAVDVFVSDANEKPVSVEGYKGTAVLVIGGKPHRIQLAPAKDNRLSEPPMSTCRRRSRARCRCSCPTVLGAGAFSIA